MNAELQVLAIKLLIIVGATQAFRALGNACGPRWGGLVLGLPCSTALVLYFYSQRCANPADLNCYLESLIFGQTAVAVLPVVYASGIARGRSSTVSLIAGVAAFLVVGRVTAEFAEGANVIIAVIVSLIASFIAVKTAEGIPLGSSSQKVSS